MATCVKKETCIGYNLQLNKREAAALNELLGEVMGGQPELEAISSALTACNVPLNEKNRFFGQQSIKVKFSALDEYLNTL